MFKKAFLLVLLATAIFASPLSNQINPIPDCFPCDKIASVQINPIPDCFPCDHVAQR